jgi:mRNA-degrading endonuclease RelE of RelBE toxin-antitoxin system
VGNYRLLIKPSAAKELDAVPKKDRERLVLRIRELTSIHDRSVARNSPEKLITDSGRAITA